jgi:hypothetical protein
MTDTSPPRRQWYVVSIWAEPQASQPPAWRGALETADGQRLYFASLTDLNSLLTTLGGWADPELALPDIPAQQTL